MSPLVPEIEVAPVWFIGQEGRCELLLAKPLAAPGRWESGPEEVRFAQVTNSNHYNVQKLFDMHG